MSVLRGPVLPAVIAVGVVAASVAGTVALSSGHRAAGAAAPAAPPPVRNAAWTVDGAHDAPALSALTGFWIGADVVVRGGVDGLHAVKRADGSAAWDLPTPGGGNLCGMSVALDGGIGVVAAQGTSGSHADCSSLSGVDTATGKVLWTTPASSSFGDPDAGPAEYAVAAGVVVVDSDRSGSGTGVIALDLRTGVEKWKHDAGCEHQPGGFAVGGGRVALAEGCQGKTTVHLLDAATGGPVAGVPDPSAGARTQPRFLAASPLVFADESGLFSTLTGNGPSRAQAAVGKDVVCAGGSKAACWTGDRVPVTPHGLPSEGAERHDVYAVTGTGDAARIVTTGVPGHPRASLCRVAADGGVVVEADLSQAVSDYLGKNGTAGNFYLYADAKDLYVVDPHPNGLTAVIDVRL